MLGHVATRVLEAEIELDLARRTARHEQGCLCRRDTVTEATKAAAAPFRVCSTHHRLISVSLYNARMTGGKHTCSAAEMLL